MEWKLEDCRDIDTVLVFAILVINKRSNLVKWNEKKRQDWTAVGGNCPVGGLFWTDEKKEKWKDMKTWRIWMENWVLPCSCWLSHFFRRRYHKFAWKTFWLQQEENQRNFSRTPRTIWQSIVNNLVGDWC